MRTRCEIGLCLRMRGWPHRPTWFENHVILMAGAPRWRITLSCRSKYRNASFWIDIDPKDQGRIGAARAGAMIGRGAIRGRVALDRQHRFRIMIGPVDLQSYLRFTPKGADLPHLVEWVRAFVGRELELRINPESTLPAQMGGTCSRWTGPAGLAARESRSPDQRHGVRAGTLCASVQASHSINQAEFTTRNSIEKNEAGKQKRHASDTTKSNDVRSEWAKPITAAEPCGPDLEYDHDFVVLFASAAAKQDVRELRRCRSPHQLERSRARLPAFAEPDQGYSVWGFVRALPDTPVRCAGAGRGPHAIGLWLRARCIHTKDRITGGTKRGRCA